MVDAKKGPKGNKVKKVISCLNRGWKDVDKIVAESGAAISTVRTQMYKYKKEKGKALKK